MAIDLFQPTFTRNFMEVGGCGKEFMAAAQKCEEAAKGGGGDRDDVKACVKATTALRRCMAAHETFFKPYYIGALDAGIKDNEKHGYGGDEFVVDENQMMRWRWWGNMRRR